jgi:hypothetical protein
MTASTIYIMETMQGPRVLTDVDPVKYKLALMTTLQNDQELDLHAVTILIKMPAGRLVPLIEMEDAYCLAGATPAFYDALTDLTTRGIMERNVGKEAEVDYQLTLLGIRLKRHLLTQFYTYLDLTGDL